MGVVAARGRGVVGGVADLVVGLAAALLLVPSVVAVMPAPVGAVAGGPRGRGLVQQLAQEPPDGLHRNGL
jgi:hypothetical protein